MNFMAPNFSNFIKIIEYEKASEEIICITVGLKRYSAEIE